MGRHEQRLQNGTLKALKQLKELQKETRLEKSVQRKRPNLGSFPHPNLRPPQPPKTLQNQTAAPVVEAQKQAA
jgi:hypothetical protein